MAAPQLPPSPQPILATINTLGGSAEVTFDRSLRETGPWDTGNWYAVTGGFLWVTSNVAVSGAVVTLTISADSPSLDPAGLYFQPPPFDLRGTNGQRVVGFAAFPFS